MGYQRHHAIVVTSYRWDLIDTAYREAVALGMTVTSIVISPMNLVYSFFVAPDGSQESWTRSKHGDEQRTAFKKWLDQQRFEDGSTPLNWAEVQYGDTDGKTCVVAHSDEPIREKPGCLP
jgi:hypothetical protein